MENQAEQTVWAVFSCSCECEPHNLMAVAATLELAIEICEHEKQVNNEGNVNEDPDKWWNQIEVWRLHDQPPVNYGRDYDGFLIQERKFKVPSQYVLK
jgi:hypothetical protein